MPLLKNETTATGPGLTSSACMPVIPSFRRPDRCQPPGCSYRRVHPSQLPDGPVSGISAAKLRLPVVRPGTIYRSPLLGQLARDESPVVSVIAPAGYGKTMLLSQWAERDSQAFAWITLDEGDNDPKVLVTYVAEALNAIEPISRRVFSALASPTSPVLRSVVPRLCQAFLSMTSPIVLVLDDVHLLRNSECRAAVSLLARHIPAGSRLVLAGRSEPPLRVARLRAEGMILEIGPGDLSLTREEASSLLRTAEMTLSEHEVAELHGRTEGWAVGLYLAALYLKEEGSRAGAVAAFGGDDRFVREYIDSEFLARTSAAQRKFLTRTAVLDRMYGPLCDAVLKVNGSGARLTELAQSGLLLVPLDHRAQWYRYHHLFRDMLLAELQRTESGLIPVLRRRAADWCLQNGLPDKALQCSIAPGALTVGNTLMREMDELLKQPGRGTLSGQAQASLAQLPEQRCCGVPSGSALTAAELRLLPLLSTHLSFPEIAAEMFLSPNTIKSQVMSIYRKLGASTRSQAVTRAHEMGFAEWFR
jgi:LuxR family transcriptional regulator, maltose regulon positive regulatory protein